MRSPPPEGRRSILIRFHIVFYLQEKYKYPFRFSSLCPDFFGWGMDEKRPAAHRRRPFGPV
jgi:hypothetical protein